MTRKLECSKKSNTRDRFSSIKEVRLHLRRTLLGHFGNMASNCFVVLRRSVGKAIDKVV